MERYLEITVTTDEPFATKASHALEAAGIPVMIEHVEVRSGSTVEPGFRVLVPSHLAQNALRLVSASHSGA